MSRPAPLPATPADEEPELTTLRRDLRALHDEGQLSPEQEAPVDLAQRLIRIGERDLPLGRLVEGHVNALRLIEVHGTAEQDAAARATAARGILYGVWGADATRPVAIRGGALDGGKRYASGLGLVGRALVTAGTGAEQRLVLVDATDTTRQQPETWDMAGMQASRSGDFDCTGLPAPPDSLIGPPGALPREPFFLGGTWRIGAVTLGGTLGLLAAARDGLRARGQIDAEAHVARIAPILFRALAAGAQVRRAAEVAEGPRGAADGDHAAALSLSTRLLTEEIGQAAIAVCEQCLGLGMFRSGDPAGRKARDLATYMRQAARDAFLQRAGRHFLQGSTPLSRWLDD